MNSLKSFFLCTYLSNGINEDNKFQNDYFERNPKKK